MRNVGRRINNIEKKLRVGQHQEPPFPRISIALFGGRKMTEEDRQKLGPIQSWITYQEQFQAGERANDEYLKNNPNGLPEVVTIVYDVDKEYEARENLQKTTKFNKTANSEAQGISPNTDYGEKGNAQY